MVRLLAAIARDWPLIWEMISRGSLRPTDFLSGAMTLLYIKAEF
jgi:hypothetical protein